MLISYGYEEYSPQRLLIFLVFCVPLEQSGGNIFWKTDQIIRLISRTLRLLFVPLRELYEKRAEQNGIEMKRGEEKARNIPISSKAI
jgi:hypothetical protein